MVNKLLSLSSSHAVRWHCTAGSERRVAEIKSWFLCRRARIYIAQVRKGHKCATQKTVGCEHFQLDAVYCCRQGRERNCGPGGKQRAACRRVYDSRHAAGWLQRTGIGSGTLRSAVEYGLHFLRVTVAARRRLKVEVTGQGQCSMQNVRSTRVSTATSYECWYIHYYSHKLQLRKQEIKKKTKEKETHNVSNAY